MGPNIAENYSTIIQDLVNRARLALFAISVTFVVGLHIYFEKADIDFFQNLSISKLQKQLQLKTYDNVQITNNLYFTYSDICAFDDLSKMTLEEIVLESEPCRALVSEFLIAIKETHCSVDSEDYVEGHKCTLCDTIKIQDENLSLEKGSHKEPLNKMVNKLYSVQAAIRKVKRIEEFAFSKHFAIENTIYQLKDIALERRGIDLYGLTLLSATTGPLILGVLILLQFYLYGLSKEIRLTIVKGIPAANGFIGFHRSRVSKSIFFTWLQIPAFFGFYTIDGNPEDSRLTLLFFSFSLSIIGVLTFRNCWDSAQEMLFNSKVRFVEKNKANNFNSKNQGRKKEE